MGKDNTDTDIICPNAQNDRKKSIKDKENSIETRNAKSSKPIIKVRKDLAEVLEDENTNDSNTSTNSKSNKSSTSSHTSSSTSNKNRRSNNLNSTKENDSEDTEPKNKVEESTSAQFCVASNNPTEFKLRIVPLEKLLERPPPKDHTPPSTPVLRTTRIKKENLPTDTSRRLPQRRSKPVSFIELSDSEEETDEEDIIISSSSDSDKKNKSRKTEASKRKTNKQPSSESEAEEEPKTPITKKKAHKKSSNSESKEDDEPTRSKNLRRKPVQKSSESEEDQQTKASSKKNSVDKSSNSEEDKSIKSDSKKKSGDKVPDKSKKSSSDRKATGKSSDSSESEEEDKEEQVTKSTKKKSANTLIDSEERKVTRSESKKKSDEKVADSSENKPKKSNSERKAVEKSSDSAESEEETSKRTSPKKKTAAVSPDIEENKAIKLDSEKKSDISESRENKPKKSSSEKKPESEEQSEDEEPNKSSSNKEFAKKSVVKKSNSKEEKGKDESKETEEEKESKQSEEEEESKGSEEEEESKESEGNKSRGKLNTSSSKEKTAKKSSDSEDDEANISLKVTSDCEEGEPANSDEPESKKLKRKRSEKSSESDEEESVKARSKRKANEKSVSSVKDVPVRKASTRKSTESSSEVEVKKPARTRNSTSKDTKSSSSKEKTIRKSSESDDDKPAKLKSKQRKSKVPEPPPSPSSVRRCVVRVKRSTLSDFKDIGKGKSKRKMNGTRSEKPSTSSARRRQVTSDDDSDVSYRRSANIDERLADHDYDGHDVEDEDDNDDKESQKSSDSEIIPTRKRRVFRKNKDESNNSDSDFEPKQKGKKKKRRVRRKSSDDSDDDDDEKKKNKRKDIRKIMKSDDLNLSTKEAAKEEEDRRKRIEERQKIYNQIYEKPDSAEVTELVLDFDPETKKALLEVDKGLMKKLKPHQVTGVKFMWDACFETIKDAQEKPGSGCILAHCMGLGKTMQIVTLSHTLLSNSNKTGVERVLIISPLSTLNNWAREFKHWISFTRKRNIEIYDLSKYKDKQTRIFKLNEWFEEGGVCILGYDMYRILTNEKAKGLRKKQREQLQQSLVDPGPDMVVCDEGHLLKNEKTSISKAVTRMRTLRRIVLTGTPLQNNLKEYYCMIQFIKPNLLGTYKEYLNRFVNPISNGQYTDSTDRDIRLMKHRSHILHKLLEGCIQRRDYSVLAPYLPPKHEYVVYTTLSLLQQLLYEHYMVHQRDLSVSASEGKGAKLFQDFQELRRIWTHPMNMRINSDSVIRKKVLANDNDSLDDFICDDENDDEDAASSSDSSVDSSKSFGSAAAPPKLVKTRNDRRNATAAGEDIDSDIEDVPMAQQDDPSEWWKRFVADKELNNINHSPKLVILMRLLEQCEAIGDKLLVFSQSLQSLDTIEHFLSLIDSKTRGYEYEGDVGEFTGFWSPGTDYFRLDGSCSVEQRESMCKKFNDTSNLRSRLFLISTRAGGLGINLVSANRVVIFDVSWNPSHDTQSIFRVYRFGQEKPCYIYRLIAMGTMEQKLYERQVAKQATAKRVIDEQQISRHYNQSDLQELYTYELIPSAPREIPILPKDRLFAELLTEHESLLFKYHEHDSLLENEESENLSADERKAAWSEYEAEKTRTVQTAQYMSYDRAAFGQFGNSSGSVTSNKIFGFRSDVLLQLLNMKITKDHPEMTQNQVIQVVPTYLNQLYSQMNSGDPTMYKDLLTLHATLVHPSGMYMNPLLYVNQNPSAAGYFQGAGGPVPPAANGIVGAPMAPPGVIAGPPMPAVIQPAPAVAPAPGFDPNEVYEID